MSDMNQENVDLLSGFSFLLILRDKRITKTEKYILFSILAVDLEQGFPDILEIPVRIFDDYDVRGHGHIKRCLLKLQEVGYLRDVGFIRRREDGYRVTTVRINRHFHATSDEDNSTEIEDDLMEA